jgi:hypothetical protein
MPSTARAYPPENLRQPQRGKLDAIDYAHTYLKIRSFADLGGIGSVFGQYSFYAIEKPGIDCGILVDLESNDWMQEQVAQRDGLSVIRGNFTSSEIADAVGDIDAVLLFDVLLHQVRPDWNHVLELYAPQTQCFIIANPQWEQTAETVRLIELGRERYLNAVPPSKRHEELFDRLDQVFEHFGRPFRDCPHVWQWGITDEDVLSTLGRLGFRLDYMARHAPFWGANGFVNKAFVFSRE